ncbi:DEAD/DEAH box helicase [Clostridium sp. MSJ-8]|uniref:DEAD/DEAH box helicase n=1 Tax=Clostridium sp. MSJ-8 TaxID=2841510 RepID=UPI001C0EF916|nr:DEAD/DEAH box helicase [Clostridium sp. MSJ-8]MBU5486673.1 DEAD/DEAH box helicase [Clostridium sp. MSJ-8]
MGNVINKINSSIGLDIESKNIIEDSYIIKNKLIVNSKRGNLYKELKESLSECKKFYFSVAFINFSGLQLLLDSFKELEDRGVNGKIITSTYLNFTEPKALKKLREFENIDLKIFVADKEKGFHTKVYIFENEDNYKVIIGSSNITQRALKSNVEWNVMILSKRETEFIQSVIEEYDDIWNSTNYVDEEFLDKYNEFISNLRNREKSHIIEFQEYKRIKPNIMQEKALVNLKRLREIGENKGLVIAATGTGKTYMSAFDVLRFKPKKLLFLVHREDILRSARETYTSLLRNKNIKTGLYTGSSKDKDADYLFSTIQTMERHINEFAVDEFEYIVMDEAHHSTSKTAQKILNYFKPEFLLGITATPERCDEGNIFDVFDNNVALEIRLNEALENELIVPFHYFGITDIEDVNYDGLDIDNISEVAKRLMINSRVDFILDKMRFYGHDGNKLKAIGFCINKEHAKYMANEFNKRGIESIALTSEDSIDRRENAIAKLDDEQCGLKVIFTVDIFNEGVDIPAINQILMLRPTSSPIIFIQQLGRGLRKHVSKEFLTVLDFIGNHNKAFLIAIALKGSKYYDKDSLKVAVATNFDDVPGCSNIQMDKISQEKILKQLNNENFNSLKYLKSEYNEFKALLGGKIPYKLMDYIKYDGSPDPLRFIGYSKSYQEFLSKVEVSYDNNMDEEFMKIIRELSSKLPLKRPYEFAIIKAMLDNDRINIEMAQNIMRKYLDTVDKKTIIHAFRNLDQEFYDTRQQKDCVKLFNYSGETLEKLISFEKICHDKGELDILIDLLNYGLISYEKRYGSYNYGTPFFKLYEQYQMVDTALLSNYEKKHSSFRGSGLITNGNEYFLFIDLHKDENIKESINYKDKFISREIFQWQSPNSTSQESERGKNIIDNCNRHVNLHLFVRKYKEIDKKVQPYIYIGKGDTIKYEGEKPITVKLKLENKIPESLYIEFTKKV